MSVCLKYLYNRALEREIFVRPVISFDIALPFFEHKRENESTNTHSKRMRVETRDAQLSVEIKHEAWTKLFRTTDVTDVEYAN